jgi:hypothetical protein
VDCSLVIRAVQTAGQRVSKKAHSYPTREEYFVVAPARVESKTRYGIDKFNVQWQPRQLGISFAAGA